MPRAKMTLWGTKIAPVKTTIWVEPEDQPFLSLSEDGDLAIEIPGAEHAYVIVIDGRLLPDLQKTMRPPRDEHRATVREALGVAYDNALNDRQAERFEAALAAMDREG